MSATVSHAASTSWNGLYSHSYGKMKITNQSKTKFKFSISVSNNHTGDFSGTATYKGNKAKVNQNHCKMEFYKTKTIVKVNEISCMYWHGAGISFDGTYRKR
jgi:hypothetical protein